MKRHPPRYAAGELVKVPGHPHPHLCKIDRVLKDRKSLRWKYILRMLCCGGRIGWSGEADLEVPTEEEVAAFVLEKAVAHG